MPPSTLEPENKLLIISHLQLGPRHNRIIKFILTELEQFELHRVSDILTRALNLHDSVVGCHVGEYWEQIWIIF